MRGSWTHSDLWKGWSSQREQQRQDLEVETELCTLREQKAVLFGRKRAESGIKWDLGLVDYGKEYGFNFKINGELVEGFKQGSGMIWFSFFIQVTKLVNEKWNWKPDIYHYRALFSTTVQADSI